MSKEPTRHQLSSRLQYHAQKPAFLQRLQNRVSGAVDAEDDEYEYDGSGRPPIPTRPAIPERPDDDPGSENEDDGDEAPQVVVIKEGKHLTEREAENERRKAKGLPPLADPEDPAVNNDKASAESLSSKAAKSAPSQAQSLSFSSGGSNKKATSKKRKIVTTEESESQPESKSKQPAKKAKKAQKKLLSFADGDDA